MFATLLFSAAALSASPADSLAEAPQRAAELVAQLGDPSYRLREKAANELIKLGSAALEPLRKGLAHPDAEIGDRCRKLLPLALDHHLQEQIAVFLDKPDDPIPEGLPGIKRWIKVAGTGKESRQLYALLAREQRRLLIEIEQHPESAGQRFQNFCADVYSRTRGATVATRRDVVIYSELILYLFLGADPEIRKNIGATAGPPHLHAVAFFNSTYLTAMLSGDAANEATKKLFLSWLEQERYMTLVRRGYQLAAAANLKEAAPLALRVAADKSIVPTSRSYALMGAVTLFGPDHLRQLEALMKDDTVVGRTTVVNGEPATAEIRDIALGIALQATGQRPGDYGFERLNNSVAATASYYYYTLTEKQREHAFAKWKEWSEKQKK
jgi:hypothetical protein